MPKYSTTSDSSHLFHLGVDKPNWIFSNQTWDTFFVVLDSFCVLSSPAKINTGEQQAKRGVPCKITSLTFLLQVKCFEN